MNTTTPSKTPVADYFRDPKNYIKSPMAVNAKGEQVAPDCESAERRSLVGAVIWIYPGEFHSRRTTYSKISGAIFYLFPQRADNSSGYFRVVASFSDHPNTTPADVLAVCLEAGV